MQTGDYVVHRTGKVCRIDRTEEMNLTGTVRTYLVLSPVRDQSETIYVPADNADSVLRPVISEADARKLIREIDDIEPLQIHNERQREQEYKTAFYSQNYVNLVRIAKDLRRRRDSRMKQGKTLPARDAQMMSMVTKTFEEGMAVALGVDMEEVRDMIEKNN